MKAGHDSFEPVDPILLGVWRFPEKPGERRDQVRGIGEPPSMKTPRRSKHHSGVMLAGGRPGPDDAIKVLDVLGGDCPTLDGAMAEEVLVGQDGQSRIVSGGEDVVTSSSESLGRRRGMVDVKEQLHRERSCWRRRQSASASSATLALESIAASISSGKAA